LTTKTLEKGPEIFIRLNGNQPCAFVGSPKKKHYVGLKRIHMRDLASANRRSLKNLVVVSYDQRSTDKILQECLKNKTKIHNLLTIDPPRSESIPSLSGIFEHVIGASPGFTWILPEEMESTLLADDASDRFIGGAVDLKGRTLALVRGNLATLVVTFDYFTPSGDGLKPDFAKLSFADYGHTVALGEYEASTDGILYTYDENYRKNIKKARIESERSFGSSLRRLRLQRGLKRSDFTPLQAKTIARIERGEVETPQGKTLEKIARTLGVSSDQIETY
jgi:hypothetical protein